MYRVSKRKSVSKLPNPLISLSRCFWWRASRAVGQFAGVPIGVAVRENFNRNFARKIDRKLVVQPRAWSHVYLKFCGITLVNFAPKILR